MTKIPKDATLVFDGIRAKVFQWEQEQFDGSYKTFEVTLKRPGVQMIIITKDNKIILSQEEQPYVGKFINLPSGCIEDNEAPIETVKKELLEELGLKSNNITLFTKIESGNSVISTSYIYLVKDIMKISKPCLEVGEKIEPLEVTFEEFIELSQRDEFRDKLLQQKLSRLSAKEIEEFKNKIFGVKQIQNCKKF